MTPDQAQALLNEAQATLETGDAPRALALFQAVMAEDGADPHQQADAECGVGEIAFLARRFSEAAERFHRAAHLDPGNSAWLHYRLGEARMRSGEWPQAVSAFREALEGFPEEERHARAEILGRLGRARVLLGERAGEADIGKAIDLDPLHAPLHADLGDCLLGRKAWAAAAESYARAVELEPDNLDYAAARARALAIAEKLAKGSPGA